MHSNCGDTNDEKARPNLKISSILKLSKYLWQFHFDIRYKKNRPKFSPKSYFDADYVSDDVTVRLWTLPTIFMFILLREFFSYGARY